MTPTRFEVWARRVGEAVIQVPIIPTDQEFRTAVMEALKVLHEIASLGGVSRHVLECAVADWLTFKRLKRE